MIVGGDDGDGVAGFWSSVGKELKAGGAEVARGAGRSAAGYVGDRLTQASQSGPPAPAPKPEGIPKGLLIAGSVVVGVGVIALLASRGGKRPTATNPRRRRRRRRRR